MQYAQALQETLANETTYTVRVGVGSICQSLQELAGSYKAARQACTLGAVFAPGENVHLYSQLLLERILSEIPPEARKSYASVLTGRLRENRLDTEETYTIADMLLDTNLNVAETARKLYMHRNTLTYRLNNLHRATGLDLRCFRDAMLYRILMDMEKCDEGEQNT